MPSPDMNWNEGHPDDGLLHEWIEEQLAVDEAARVSAHVDSCTECRERVAEVHGLIAASRRILSSLDGVPVGVIPARPMSLPTGAAETPLPALHVASTNAPAVRAGSPTSFRWRRWGAIAAVMLLAVTGVVVVNQGNDVMQDAITAPANSTSLASAQRGTADSSAASSTAMRAAPGRVDSVTPAVATAPVNADKRKAAVNSALRKAAERPSGASNGVATRDTRDLAVAGAAGGRVLAGAPVSVPPAVTQKAEARSVPLPVNAPTSPPAVQPPVQLQGKTEPMHRGVAGGVARAAPPVAPGDTLAARLEAERKRRMASEAVTADLSKRPRIDAIGAAPQGNASFAPRPMGSFAFDSLVLTREPCFGSCPWYDLFVDGGGRVRYQSHHMGDTTSERRAMLSSADLGRLRDLLQRANVETLKSYVSGTPECGLTATDMPSIKLRVFQGGRWYRIEQYQGCRAATPVLTNLTREIDTIVGTQRWLPPGIRLN